MIPNHLQLLFSADQIAEKVKELGDSITEWAEQCVSLYGSDIILVPILRGGLLFSSDLMRKIKVSVEVAPLTVSSYSSVKNNTPHISVSLSDLGTNVDGRTILLVDDICDSGRTLSVLSEKLHLMGVREIRSAVLIHRLISNTLCTPSYIGFPYEGMEWLVGYGLEDRGRFRNLDAVYKIVSG
jgi:hypoxanthine phosphoribosyltransferase